jgi:methionine-rich copper-binding protein CopC
MRKFALFGAIALTLGTAMPASAHTHLVRSAPVANGTVAAPAALTLTFNERLAPAFSRAEVTMPGHDMAVPVTMRLSRDGKTMTLTPRSALHRGSYVISWVAAGSDGHRMEGTVPFAIR